jgi:hypothetical protein
MLRLPKDLKDLLGDIFKEAGIGFRNFPGVHIHWQGCGDSGGIEDFTALTQAGIDYAKAHGCAPPTWRRKDASSNDPIDLEYYARIPGDIGMGNYRATLPLRERGRYELSEWVYNKFNLCEINDGGYGHIFIEMPFGKVWGESYDWVQEEVSNTLIDYEN